MKKEKQRNPLVSTPAEKLMYCLNNLGISILWAIPSSFMTVYYTDSVGLAAAFVGTMMLLCRLLDCKIDSIFPTRVSYTNSNDTEQD